MKKTKKRNKPYVPREAKVPMLVITCANLWPLDSIVRQINTDGTINVSAKGVPVCKDIRTGKYFDVIPVLAELISFLEMYEIRHALKMPIEPIREFSRFLEYGMPISETMASKMKIACETMQRRFSFSEQNDAKDLLTQVHIKDAIGKTSLGQLKMQ